MSERNEQGTYKSVTDELEELLNLAPDEIKETWNTDIDQKNKEDEELGNIELAKKNTIGVYALYEAVIKLNNSTEKAKAKEKEIEMAFIEEYKKDKKLGESYIKLVGNWVYSIVIAIVLTLTAGIVALVFGIIGIIAGIIILIFAWGKVDEKREEKESAERSKNYAQRVEEKYIVTNDSVRFR